MKNIYHAPNNLHSILEFNSYFVRSIIKVYIVTTVVYTIDTFINKVKIPSCKCCSIEDDDSILKLHFNS